MTKLLSAKTSINAENGVHYASNFDKPSEEPNFTYLLKKVSIPLSTDNFLLNSFLHNNSDAILSLYPETKHEDLMYHEEKILGKHLEKTPALLKALSPVVMTKFSLSMGSESRFFVLFGMISFEDSSKDELVVDFFHPSLPEEFNARNKTELTGMQEMESTGELTNRESGKFRLDLSLFEKNHYEENPTEILEESFYLFESLTEETVKRLAGLIKIYARKFLSTNHLEGRSKNRVVSFDILSSSETTLFKARAALYSEEKKLVDECLGVSLSAVKGDFKKTSSQLKRDLKRYGITLEEKEMTVEVDDIEPKKVKPRIGLV